VFVTAPQPGVLASRYVEHLVANEAEPAWLAAKEAVRQPATISLEPIHPSGALRLSASQLSTYEDCPRRWFYDNVLRLADSSSVWSDFGSLVHEVLERFLAPTSTVEYSLDALLDLAEQCWNDDIAAFAPQREQARRELDDVLRTWWAMEGEYFDRSKVIEVEHAFDVTVAGHAVRGRIDRVDQDPSRNGIAVADYKSGRHAPREVDVADDLQLAVYYLAALRSEALAAVGPPSRLELLYIRLGKRFEQPITADHEARAEARILEAADEMLAEHLEPLPTADCDHCDYHRLCPLQRAGREVGMR
jgi:DNA helicase-2/ATP-dependent DNA helicase PcrA